MNADHRDDPQRRRIRECAVEDYERRFVQRGALHAHEHPA
jgi:hypothetical protein